MERQIDSLIHKRDVTATYSRFVLTPFLLTLIYCWIYPQAQKYTVPERVCNHDGWDIPGWKYLKTDFTFESAKEIEVDGITVKKSTYYATGRLDYSKPVDTSKYVLLPTILTFDKNSVSYELRLYGAFRITQYETAKGTFCIDTKVAPYVEDKQSGHGGAGPATCLAFFGEDGDGKFESMEYSTVVMGDPNRRRLHVPKWASGPSSNN